MAKSKSKPKKPIDEEEPQVKGKKKAKEEAVEEATELDADAEEAAEVDANEAEEPATEVDADKEVAEADEDAEAKDADAEGAVDGGDADADDDEEDTTPPPPTPKLTKTAAALIMLNWMIAPAFLLFAYLDHMVRVEYAHRTLVNYIQIWGLPLADENDNGSFHTQTRPRLKLTSEQLSEAVKLRTKRTYKELAAYEEPTPLAVLVRKSDITDQVIKDVFDYQGVSFTPKVVTLEDAIERVKSDVPTKVEAAAGEVLATLKTDAEKRTVVQQQLFDIAWDYKQIHRLAEKLANAKGKDLDEMVKESVERRLYYDILAPLNVFRSDELADSKNYKIEKISNIEKYKLADVKGFFADRMKAATDAEFSANLHIGEDWAKEKVSVTEGGKQINSMMRTSDEKRQVIGFIMFTLSQVRVAPLEKKDKDGKFEPKYLIDKGVERAQVVCGLSEFTNASLRYVVTMRILNERKIQAVNDLRDGYVHLVKGKTDEFTRTMGTTAEREGEVDRLVKIVEHIDAAKKRLGDLQGQHKEFDKIHTQRKQQHTDTFNKLLAARGTTEKYVKELHVLQEQLHTALVDLSEAGDRNLRLYQEIYTIEMEMMKKSAPKQKGGKN